MEALHAKLAGGEPLMMAEAVEMLREHAREAFPQESLGYVAPDGSYQRLVNVSPSPERSAYAEPSLLRDLYVGGQVRALVHSHPGGPDCPSENDMRAQIEMEVPFILVSTDGSATTEPFAWGDQLLDERPLVGRSFRHAVEDCYDLIRSFVQQEEGVLLPNYPRNWEWWAEATPGEKNLYARYFADAGYRTIDQSEVRHGDVWLAVVGRQALATYTPNHAGVFLEGGLALHHASSGLPHDPGRLSKREPMARWMPYVSHWLRRCP